MTKVPRVRERKYQCTQCSHRTSDKTSLKRHADNVHAFDVHAIDRSEVEDPNEKVEDGERWRVVTKFPNYSVSDRGRVRNDQHNRFLTLKLANGYVETYLYHQNKRTTLKLHRVVAQAFLYHPTGTKYSVDHIDRDPQNNNVENLRWATQKQQVHNRIVPTRLRSTAVPQADLEWAAIPPSMIDGTTGYEIANKQGWLRYTGENTTLVTKAPRLPHKNKATRYCLHQIHTRKYAAHRLVAAAFMGECPDNYVVDHIDENRGNCDIVNLRYVTRSVNSNHSKVVRAAVTYHMTQDGVAIARFISMREAARVTQSDIGSIGNACAFGCRALSKRDNVQYYWKKVQKQV